MNKHDWLEIYKRIFSSKDDFILYKGNRFDYQYIGDSATNIGYLHVWSLDIMRWS